MITAADRLVWTLCGGGPQPSTAAAAASTAGSGSTATAAAAASASASATVSAAVGGGKSGYVDGDGTSAEFAQPSALAVYSTPLTHAFPVASGGSRSGGGAASRGGSGSGAGAGVTVWVADTYNHVIRKVFDPERKRMDRADARLRYVCIPLLHALSPHFNSHPHHHHHHHLTSRVSVVAGG
jgi:hypothetical protein